MAINDDRLGFRIVTVRRGDAGGLVTAARYQCVECGELRDLRIRPGKPLNAEGYANRMQEDGWQVDPWKKNRCWCPRCAGPRKPKPAPEATPTSETRKVIPMTQAVPIREITAAQKQRVRSLLDKHFDDAIGAYLDGMTDLKVAEEVGIPRTFVEQIRDAAYGPIRISPEISDARAAIEALRKDIATQAAKVAGLEAKAAEIASRIDRIATGKAA